MGYFEAISNSGFKRDEHAMTVFYPWGVLGRGRVLPDAETETQLRRFVRYYNMAAVVSIIAVAVLLGALVSLALLPGLFVIYRIRMQTLLADCRFSDEPLTLDESYGNTAAGLSGTTLKLLLGCSALFVLAGLGMFFAAIFAGHLNLMFSGLSAVLFFGICCGVFLYMIRLRNQDEDRLAGGE